MGVPERWSQRSTLTALNIYVLHKRLILQGRRIVILQPGVFVGFKNLETSKVQILAFNSGISEATRKLLGPKLAAAGLCPCSPV